MKLLLDTNVVLDALLGRDPWFADAAALFARVETGKCDGVLCATTITTVHYVARKVVGTEGATERIGSLMRLFDVAAVSRPVVEAALKSEFADFEDAVLYESAVRVGCQAVVTRNLQDFRSARLPVYEPAQALVWLGSI